MFDGDISKRYVSRAIDMNDMFLGVQSWNGDLSKWEVSNVQTMSGRLDLDVSHVTNMHVIPSATSVYDNIISKWDVSSVKVYYSNIILIFIDILF